MVAICNIVLFLEINGNTNLAKRPHTQSCYYICQDCLVHLGDIGKLVIKCTVHYYCVQQEEPAILSSRLLLRMRCLYVASICADFP